MVRASIRSAILLILVLIVGLQVLYPGVDWFISHTQAEPDTNQSPTPSATSSSSAETDKISKLERRISESEERVRDYAERSASWALWTLRLVGTLGAIAALLIAAGSIVGLLGAQRLRKEASAAAKIREDMEAHFSNLKGVFVGFAKTIDIPKLLYSKEKLSPMDEERFKEFDIQLLLADVIGAKLDAEVFERLGWFWHTLGVNERALLRFDKALELKPTGVDSIYGKGISLGLLAAEMRDTAKQNDMRKEALDYIDRAIDQGHLRHRYLFARGWVLDDMNRFPEALAAYEEARRIAPGDPMITYNIACTYARSKQYQKALEELEKIREHRQHIAFASEDPELTELRVHPTHGQRFSEIVK